MNNLAFNFGRDRFRQKPEPANDAGQQMNGKRAFASLFQRQQPGPPVNLGSNYPSPMDAYKQSFQPPGMMHPGGTPGFYGQQYALQAPMGPPNGLGAFSIPQSPGEQLMERGKDQLMRRIPGMGGQMGSPGGMGMPNWFTPGIAPNYQQRPPSFDYRQLIPLIRGLI